MEVRSGMNGLVEVGVVAHTPGGTGYGYWFWSGRGLGTNWLRYPGSGSSGEANNVVGESGIGGLSRSDAGGTTVATRRTAPGLGAFGGSRAMTTRG